MAPENPRGPVRSIRVAGLLGVLFGISGVLTGLAAAGTFIPFRQGEPWDASAEVMTVVAAAGAAVSVLGIVSGWGLRRAKGWAWGVAIGVAAGCVALNLLMPAFMGLGYLAFAAFVAVAYGVEVALLVVGRRSFGGRAATARPA